MKKSRIPSQKLRQNYTDQGLLEKEAPAAPLPLFQQWFREALKKGVPMPHAMILSTVTSKKRPASRTVLLKDYGPCGFVFFTNYESAKGRELRKCPRAALLFYWPGMEKQIRIEGRVSRTSSAVSTAYFQSRPRKYRLGALASSQSRSIRDREVLERRFHELEKQYRGKPVPRHAAGGGYIVKPDLFEFWQGRTSRLHDRLRYRRPGSGKWKRERLAP